ncbi:radical SAM protein [bacterium]|nr:MAG: radical SAM protein [bacterium]
MPAYLKLHRDELEKRAGMLADLASPCQLCPRACGSIRKSGEVGYCRTGFEPMISSAHAHFGEEAPLTGTRGSGTIFFTNCNLGCIFCQNYDISHQGAGRIISTDELARLMLALQKQGCHNINLVTPTHQIHSIVDALASAVEGGLCVPIVYNTGGYDSVDTIRLLEDIVDIFMPDLKFGYPEPAKDLAEAPDYPQVVRDAVAQMHLQVGDLELNKNGTALRGLLIRHLVLPHGLAGSREVFRFLSEEISPDTYLNIMAQYRPCWKAVGAAKIGEPLQSKDYLQALALAREYGLTRLD